MAAASSPPSRRTPSSSASPAEGAGPLQSRRPFAAALLPTHHDTLTLRLRRRQSDARITAENLLPGRSNYFIGADPAQWHTNVPNYSLVRIQNIYPGIDVRFYGNDKGLLEYDFLVQPGADPAQIHLAFDGAVASLDPAGYAHFQTPSGDLRSWIPTAYQLDNNSGGANSPLSPSDGGRGAGGANSPLSPPDGGRGAGGEGVPASYIPLPDNQLGFQLSAYDPARTLVIDPSLDYGTYLGGAGVDEAHAIAADAAGYVYVAGKSGSDAFVTKLSPDGSQVLYTEYLGGSGNDYANAVAVDLAGHAYITGYAASSDFPTTSGAVQTTGSDTIFLAKLNATGDAPLYSTYFGTAGGGLGPGSNEGFGVAVDAQGQATITGGAYGTIPATTGAYQTSKGGLGLTQDVFVARFNAAGSSALYATYLGGEGNDVGQGVAIDADGYAYVTGTTAPALLGANYPTTSGAYCTSFPGFNTAAFVTKLNTTGSALVYSTLFGSSSDAVTGNAVAVDAAGQAFITGATGSSGGVPTTTGAWQTSPGGNSDAFAAAFDSAGASLVFSTLIGGSGDDFGRGIALDSAGHAFVTGKTASTNFPTASPFQSSIAGGAMMYSGADAFVTELADDGASAVYSSYLGGTSDDEGNAIALDLLGAAYVAGVTSSSDFPTRNPYQATLNGTSDAFVAKITPTPDAPVITAISSDTGASSADLVTTDQTLTISGTAPASSTVDIYAPGDTAPIGTVSANSSGDWSFNYTGTTLPEGTHAFWATATLGSLTSEMSQTALVTVDQTAPTVTLIAPSTTTSFAPQIEVLAADLAGLAASPTATIDVDLNNDNDYLDTGEAGYATATVVNGYVVATLPALSATGTYHIQASVDDLAGNTGTSSTVTMTVTSATSWSLTASALLNRPDGGQSREALGAVTLSHALDLDLSPGSTQAGNPALVYDGTSLNIQPVIQGVVSAPNNAALPSTIGVELIWDGTSQGTNNDSTSSLVQGDKITVAARPTSAVSTGRHTWELRVKITGLPDLVASGTTFAVDQASSPFGAGWNLSILNRLIDVPASGSLPAGKLWLYGTGGWKFFQGTSGTFTSPADDNGTLVMNAGGDFTYTAADNSKIDFDSSGFQTDWVSPDGFESITFAYSSGLLASITAIDGTSSSFTYSSGKLSSISAPGSRTFTVSVNGSGDLASITNPDTGVHSFTYSSHRVTNETFGDHLANQWHYDSAGFLDQYTWGSSSSPSVYDIVSAASVGLAALAKGEAKATVTDALSFVTQYRFDDNNRLLQQIDPNGAKTTYTRDSAGYVTQIVDPLQRTTSYTRDSKEYVTRETLPDTTHRDWTFDSTYHSILTYADERGITLYTNTVDSPTGHVTATVDALSNETDYTFSSTTGLLDTTTDPVGIVTTVTWDSYRRMQSTESTFSTTLLDSADYTYSSSNGEIATTEDAESLVTTLGHDAMGRLTSQQLGSLTASTWVYDGAGLVTEESANGHTTSYTFDVYGRGMVTAVLAGGGLSSNLSTVDEIGRPSGSRNGRGFWTTYAYALDAAHQIVTTTDPAGGTSVDISNLDGETILASDPDGHATAYTRDADRGWVDTMTDANGNDWDYGHDAAGNETSTTDPNSNVWQTEFDDLSRVSAEIDPLLNETDTSYWENGDVQNVTDGRGLITRHVTDWAARTQTTIGAYGTADQFNIDIGHFNDAGFTTEIENGNGDSTFYIDDGYHRVGEVDNDNSDMRAIYTRDAIGNVTAAEDGETKSTAFGHDTLERTTTTTDANNNTTQPILDAEDEEVGFIDGAGAVTQQVFDPRGLETLTVDANGGLTRRAYDAAGNLWRLTDPAGNTTSWARDANGNVIQETDALGNSRYWTFDDANRVISYTDKNGRSKEYTYYDNNQLYQEIWKTAPGGSTVNTITYTWNENGQLLTATDNNGTITQTWDSANRLDTFEGVYGGTLTYVYNDASQLEEIDDSFGGSTTLAWNNIGQLTQRSFTDGTAQLAVGYQYNDRDQVTEVDRYTDAAATTLVGKTLYTIDDGGRVTDISHKNASNVVIDSFSYTLDHADRVTQETSTLGPTQNYGYDRTGQLISDSSTSYSFDLNGNRTMTGYSTGTDNRLSTDGTWNYDYDDEGNTISKTNISTGEVWQFSYDHNNRLIEAEHKPSSSGSVDLRITFVIDVLGNRVERDYDADGDGSGAATVTKFAVDPNANAWADLSSTGSLTIRRLYADAVDAIFARIGSSGNEDWYGEDRLASIRDIFDSSGSLIDEINYSSYGKPVYESNSANSDRYGFQGREREDDYGANNMRARPEFWDIGVFGSRDPLGFEAGDPNPRRFEGNNPTNVTDPSGMDGEQPRRPACCYFSIRNTDVLRPGDVSSASPEVSPVPLVLAPPRPIPFYLRRPEDPTPSSTSPSAQTLGPTTSEWRADVEARAAAQQERVLANADWDSRRRLESHAGCPANYDYSVRGFFTGFPIYGNMILGREALEDGRGWAATWHFGMAGLEFTQRKTTATIQRANSRAIAPTAIASISPATAR
ncbi:MAG: SBBP repeat-containing protein [Gemmataceae bacterium]